MGLPFLSFETFKTNFGFQGLIQNFIEVITMVCIWNTEGIFKAANRQIFLSQTLLPIRMKE